MIPAIMSSHRRFQGDVAYPQLTPLTSMAGTRAQ
jgi:hypothetical protein